MGERIVVGILMEQAPTCGDGMQARFKSLDGDYISVTGEGGSCPQLSVIDRAGSPVAARDCRLRHVLGEELVEDL